MILQLAFSLLLAFTAPLVARAEATCPQAGELAVIEKLPANERSQRSQSVLGSIAEQPSMMPEAAIAEIEKDLSAYWNSTRKLPPSCANLKLKIARLLSSLSRTSAIPEAERRKNVEALVSSVRKTEFPRLLTPMIHLGVLDEIAKSQLVTVPKSLKERFEKTLKTSKAKLRKISDGFQKVLTDEDLPKTFFSDAKYKDQVDALRQLMIQEIRASVEIQKDVDGLAEEFAKLT